MADWEEAMAEQNAADGGKDPSSYEPTQFDQPRNSNGSAAEAGSERDNLDLVLDIPVTVAMEIGRSRIAIRNLLQLSQGSVVELDRLAGEPMDVLVNGTLIAQGEVVVVNDKYGIRLTDVISPEERIKRIR